MIVVYTDEFNISVKKLTDKIAIKRLNIIVEKLKNAKELSEIPKNKNYEYNRI